MPLSEVDAARFSVGEEDQALTWAATAIQNASNGSKTAPQAPSCIRTNL